MSVRELLAELGVRTAPTGHHHTTQGWTSIDCPVCSPGSGRFRLGISDNGRAANCWTCGPMRVWDVLRESTSLPAKQLISVLRAFTGSQGHFEGSKPLRYSQGGNRATEREYGAGKCLLPACVGPLLRQHRDYLRSRGFNPAEVERLWGVRGIGLAPRLPWRLFIPVRRGTETVSWTTRSIGEQVGTPYVSAEPGQESVHIRDCLYGEENARHAIVATEGPLDAWAVGPGGVATCGVGFSRAQVQRMSGYPVRVVLFDSEPDAQRRAGDLCSLLSVFPGETFNVVLETGKDASRASRRELKQLRERFLR